MDAKDNIQWVPQRNRSERSEKLTVFRLVPVCSKPIWYAHKEGISLNLQCFRGLEPGTDYLLRKLATCLVEKSCPDIGRGQRH
jgi:hypothetical protein